MFFFFFYTKFSHVWDDNLQYYIYFCIFSRVFEKAAAPN